jgi:hypothetical protein
MVRKTVVGLRVGEPEPKNVVDFWKAVSGQGDPDGTLTTEMHKYALSLLGFVGDYRWFQEVKDGGDSYLKGRSLRSVRNKSGTDLEVKSRLVLPTNAERIISDYRERIRLRPAESARICFLDENGNRGGGVVLKRTGFYVFEPSGHYQIVESSGSRNIRVPIDEAFIAAENEKAKTDPRYYDDGLAELSKGESTSCIVADVLSCFFKK